MSTSYSALSSTRKSLMAGGGAPARTNAAVKARAASPPRRAARRPAEAERVRFSQVLRQNPSVVEPNKISVVERYITDIDPVPERFREVEVLFLSHNSIATFAGFAQFGRLRVLSLACNCIDKFSEIEALANFPQLQILNLEGNPVTITPNYRMHVIARLPRLKMLDNKEVRAAEREHAVRVMRQEEDQMASLFSNYMLERKLEAVVQRITLHSELNSVVHGRVSALNAAALPSTGQLDTRKYLEYFDFESKINAQERDRIVELLRTEIRRAKLELTQAPLQKQGAYDVYKVLVSDTEAAKAMKKKSMPEWEMWETAGKAVVTAQQAKISSLLAKVQAVRQESAARSKAIVAQSGAIHKIRREEEEREKRALEERESLIRELRGQVDSLTQATGMSINTSGQIRPAARPESALTQTSAKDTASLQENNRSLLAEISFSSESAHLNNQPTPFRSNIQPLHAHAKAAPQEDAPEAPRAPPRPTPMTPAQREDAPSSRASPAKRGSAPTRGGVPLTDKASLESAFGALLGGGGAAKQGGRSSSPVRRSIAGDLAKGSGESAASKDARSQAHREPQASALVSSNLEALNNFGEGKRHASLLAASIDAMLTTEQVSSEVASLQEQLQRHMDEEERLVAVNKALKERLENAMQQNNQNVDTAEQELQKLHQALKQTEAQKRDAEARALTLKNEAESAKRDAEARAETAKRDAEARASSAVASAEKSKRSAEVAIRDAEAAFDARVREEVAARCETEVSRERDKAEGLEKKLKAMQTMIEAMSHIEESAEASVRRQMSDVAERNAQLESMLEAARRDCQFLSQKATAAQARADELQRDVVQGAHIADAEERALALHALLVTRRAFLRYRRNTRTRREDLTIAEAACKVGDRALKSRFLGRFARAASISQRERAVRAKSLGRAYKRGEAVLARQAGRRLQALRERRELAVRRDVWGVWYNRLRAAARAACQEAEESMMTLHDSLQGHAQRVSSREVENVQLIDQVQALTSDKARGDMRIKEQATAIKELQGALEESAVIEQELRGLLEQRSAEERGLAEKNKELREELTRQHEEMARVSTQITWDRQQAEKQLDEMREVISAASLRFASTEEALIMRTADLEACKRALRDALDRAESQAALLHDGEGAAAERMRAELEESRAAVRERDGVIRELRSDLEKASKSLEREVLVSLNERERRREHLQLVDTASGTEREDESVEGSEAVGELRGLEERKRERQHEIDALREQELRRLAKRDAKDSSGADGGESDFNQDSRRGWDAQLDSESDAEPRPHQAAGVRRGWDAQLTDSESDAELRVRMSPQRLPPPRRSGRDGLHGGLEGLGEESGGDDVATFSGRKRAIDEEYRARLSRALASPHSSGVDEENVMPNASSSSLSSFTIHQPKAKQDPALSDFKTSTSDIRESSSESVSSGFFAKQLLPYTAGGDFATPLPLPTDPHHHEMANLHDEIEALQARILGRLNSNAAATGSSARH